MVTGLGPARPERAPRGHQAPALRGLEPEQDPPSDTQRRGPLLLRRFASFLRRKGVADVDIQIEITGVSASIIKYCRVRGITHRLLSLVLHSWAL